MLHTGLDTGSTSQLFSDVPFGDGRQNGLGLASGLLGTHPAPAGLFRPDDTFGPEFWFAELPDAIEAPSGDGRNSEFDLARIDVPEPMGIITFGLALLLIGALVRRNLTGKRS